MLAWPFIFFFCIYNLSQLAAPKHRGHVRLFWFQLYSQSNLLDSGRPGAPIWGQSSMPQPAKSKSSHAEPVSGRDTQMPTLHVVWAERSDNLYSYYSGFNSTYFKLSHQNSGYDTDSSGTKDAFVFARRLLRKAGIRVVTLCTQAEHVRVVSNMALKRELWFPLSKHSFSGICKPGSILSRKGLKCRFVSFIVKVSQWSWQKLRGWLKDWHSRWRESRINHHYQGYYSR